MKVKEIMNPSVVSVSPDETVKAAAEKLAVNGISGAPVVDADGRIVGILSESDILTALRKRSKALRMIYPSLSLVSVSFVEEEHTEVTKALGELAETPVREVMHSKVLTIKPADDVSLAVDLMNQNNVNRLPVVKDEKLVGIVTRGDVLKGMYKGRR
jgi:CBS domain-containing protein